MSGSSDTPALGQLLLEAMVEIRARAHELSGDCHPLDQSNWLADSALLTEIADRLEQLSRRPRNPFSAPARNLDARQ